MSAELRSKYEALIPELQGRRRELRRSRGKMFWLLVVGAITAPIAWPFGLVAFISVATLWTTLWATGVYIATMYDWGYERQIASAEAEIELLLRAEIEAASLPEGAAARAPVADAWVTRRIPRQATWGRRSN